MIENKFLIEIAKIFTCASIAGVILSKFKQPTVVAYILTGIILGPGILGLINDYSLINQLSEVGVIALLFTLGLEFSLDKFRQVKKIALFAGILQVLITIIITSILIKLYGFNETQSLLLGSIITLSSTVIVMKSLSESGQIDSIHGRIILGILVIQDLSLIPIMIILSNMTSNSTDMFIPMILPALKAIIFLSIVLFAGFKAAPVVMNLVTSINKELFLLSAVSIAVGTAIVANYFGISLALGAFVAGLALSVTAHSKQLVTEIVPFRDAFAMVFFVSIGMLMDINFFLNNFILILTVVLAIFLLKFIICFGVIYFARYPGQTALWTGLSLFQIGEFSFVLAKLGVSTKIINQDMYSLIIISALITMLLTPFVIKSIPNIVFKLHKFTFWNKHFKGKIRIEIKNSSLLDHVIICGYGPIGNNISGTLDIHEEEFVVIELNSKTVNKLKKKEIPVIYGDATHIDILRHAYTNQAKIIIITLPDARSCELAILNARKLNEDIYIIVRSRFQSDIDRLYKAGANAVIYEELETSRAIINTTLTQLGYTS